MQHERNANRKIDDGQVLRKRARSAVSGYPALSAQGAPARVRQPVQWKHAFKKKHMPLPGGFTTLAPRSGWTRVRSVLVSLGE